jgi:hypothetical protein
MLSGCVLMGSSRKFWDGRMLSGHRANKRGRFLFQVEGSPIPAQRRILSISSDIGCAVNAD